MKTLLRVGMVSLLCLLAPQAWAAPVSVTQANQRHAPGGFINTSGAAMTSGDAVILNYAASGTTTPDSSSTIGTLGLDITTTTVANSRQFVGIVASDACAAGVLCDVITYGPALAKFDCTASAPSGGVGQPVGTSTRAGQLAYGTRAGIQLSNSVSGTANGGQPCLRWVFVNPDNSSGGGGAISPD